MRLHYLSSILSLALGLSFGVSAVPSGIQQTVLQAGEPLIGEFDRETRAAEKWSVDGRDFVKQNGIACESQNSGVLL
jgi:hypothetical protein